MSATEIDRAPITQAQELTGLGRLAFYKRLQQAGIEPIRVSGHSFPGSDPAAGPGRSAALVQFCSRPLAVKGHPWLYSPASAGALLLSAP